MNLVNWMFVILFIVIIFLIIIGLWFPRGKSDWPLSPRATIYVIVAALFFILFVVLINIVSQYIGWADFITSSIYFTIIVFAFLVLLSLFFPNGLGKEFWVISIFMNNYCWTVAELNWCWTIAELIWCWTVAKLVWYWAVTWFNSAHQWPSFIMALSISNSTPPILINNSNPRLF